VTDLLEETSARIARHAPDSPDAVRACPPPVGFSPELRRRADELKRFLHHNLYPHYRVLRTIGKARRVVRQRFEANLDDPRLLPPEHRDRARDDAPRAIADYIAGMTARYAIKEHRRLFSFDIEG